MRTAHPLLRCLSIVFFLGATGMLAGCQTAKAGAPPVLLLSGAPATLAPDVQVVIEANRQATNRLVVVLRVLATGQTPIEKLFPAIVVSYDAIPTQSDARMEEGTGAITVTQTLTGNVDQIHEVTVSDTRSGRAAHWKA